MYGTGSRIDPNAAGSDANRYSVGNRVYNGNSPSPNVGPGSVDPSGYMDRDRQAAVKRNMLMQQLNTNSQMGIYGPSGGR
jgi:hypothetical protein